MTVGDLVRMDFVNPSDDDDDEWGVGIIINIEPNPIGGCDDVEVLWSKLGQTGWEISQLLDSLNENW